MPPAIIFEIQKRSSLLPRSKHTTMQVAQVFSVVRIHSWIVDTSIEYDQAVIDGFLKVSLEGLTVILRNERYLLRGLLLENEDLQKDDLFPEGFTAEHFAEIVERGKLWSVLDE